MAHINDKGASFLVGIDKYKDSRLKNFPDMASARGVELFKQKVLESSASQYNPPAKKFELLHEVSYEILDRRLEEFLSIEDYTDVLIYLSGHGYQCWDRDTEEYKGYFATSSSDISQASFYDRKENLINQSDGLAFARVAKLISKAKYLKSLVLIIDACHSGNAITTSLLQAALFEARQKSLNKAQSDNFRYCIIPSSLSVEESWIEDGIGVFTKALIETLRDNKAGSITTQELSIRIKESFQSRHHQTIKPDHSGYILLMDYALDGGKKNVQEPLYTDSSKTKLKNPYQGLDAFDESTHEFFFGREAVVGDIIALFEDSYFVCVIGASGSGKSSVVKAGLFPRLLAQDSNWVLMSMKPGDNPLRALKKQLINKVEPLLEETQAKKSLELFEDDPTQDTFAQLLEQLPQGKQFLLLIDQFEETFTLASQIENTIEQKKALENQRTFLDIITTLRSPLHVVVTLRADFLEHCLKDPKLRDLIQDYAYYIPPLRSQALRDAIQKPALRQGFDVETALVDQLEREVTNEPGALPLLEFALTQLWEKQQDADDDSKLLTLKAYNTLGEDEQTASTSSFYTSKLGKPISGLQRALDSHANTVYKFSDWQEAKTDERLVHQQHWIEQIFLRLIRPGEGTTDTRQRQPKASLLDIAGKAETREAERKELDKLIEELVDARLLVTGAPEQSPTTGELEALDERQHQQWVGDNQEVDLAHEALIEGWELFRAWRKEAQNLLRLRARIEDQRKLWEAERQDERHYLTRGLLAQVETVGWEVLQPYIRSAEDVEFYTRSKAYADEQDAVEKQRAVELQHALTEAQLRLKVNDIETKLLVGRKTEALALAIGAMGQNLERLPQKMLGPVQQALGKFVDHDYSYPKIRSLGGHRLSVNSVALSGDGETIVSSSYDGTVWVWSIDGTLLHTLKGHTDSVNSVALSADGQTVVSGSNDGTVRVWSIDGTLLRTLEGRSSFFVTSVAISADGQTIVSGSDGGTVQVWSIDGTLLSTLEGHTDSVNSVAISADGQTIVSGSNDGTVRVWSIDGTLLRTIEGRSSFFVNSVALSADGQTIVSGSDGGTVRVWSIDGTLLRTIECYSSFVTSVAISADGQTIVSGSGDYQRSPGHMIVSDIGNTRVRVWSIGGTLLHTLKGHTDSVNSVALSADGLTIVSGSNDRTVRVWSIDGTLLRTLKGHTDSVNSVALSADGQTIVSGNNDRTVRVWSIDSTLLSTLEGHTDSVNSVAISADGQTIVSGSNDRTVRVWSIDGTLLRTLKGHTDSVNSVALSADDLMIVSGSGDRTVRVWSIDGTLLRTLKGHTDSVNSVALSADDLMIVSGSGDRTVRVWSIDGTLLRTLKGHTDSVNSVALSADDLMIVSGSGDRTVRVWSIDGTLLRTLEGYTDSVNSVALSADGQTIVSGSVDNTVKFYRSGRRSDGGNCRENRMVRVWSIDGTLLHTFKGHTDSVNSVDFSADGETIVSGSHDGTVWVWAQIGWRSGLRGCLQQLGNNWTYDPEGWADRTRLFEQGYLLAENQDSVDGNELALKQFKLALQCGKPEKTAISSQLEQFSPEALETSARRLLAPVLRQQGEQFARSGYYEQALNRFKQAQEFGLDLNPIAEANRLTSSALKLQGILNALQLRTGEATAKFAQAKQYDPELELEPEAEAKRIAVPALVKTGQRLAKALKIEEATARFAQAKQYDPELELEPETEAKRIAVPALVERGQRSAKALKIEEATARFAQAKQYDPELELEPEAEAKRIAVPALVERGQRLAKALKIEEATARFAQAKQYDPELELEPEAEAKRIAAPVLFDQGKALLKKEQVLPDDVQQALEAYQTAQVYDSALTITARDWNSLLWFGILHAAKKTKLVKALLDASQEALKAEAENTDYRDTLGVARVLAGGRRNRDSAMKDFEFYITNSNGSADEKEQRQRWIKALKAGQDPFTEDEIKTLLGQ